MHNLLPRLLALIFALSTAATPATAEVSLYNPAHRTADELAPLLGPAMGHDGFAVVDRHSGQIVIHGPKANIKRALELLQDLDLPQLSYNVEFRVVSETERKSQGIEISGTLPLAELGLSAQIGAGSRSHKRGRGGLEIRAGSGTSSQTGSFRASLLVQDGTPSQIWTGKLIAIRSGGWIHEADERSGMRVETRTLRDGRVHLSLHPLRARGNRAEPLSAVTKLALETGAWVALGEVGSMRSSRSADLLGVASSEESNAQRLLVRASPLSLPASAPRPSAAE